MEIFEYEILDKIDTSDSVVIYRARDRHDNTQVILKVGSHEEPDSEVDIIFRKENELLSSFESDFFLKSRKLFHHNNCPVLVLDGFDGLPLSRRPEMRCQTLDEFLNIAIELSALMAELHQVNIFHGNFTPSSVLINSLTGQAKLYDFSLAKKLSSDQDELFAPPQLKGNLNYISPEQTGRMNLPLDFRSDLYSLGVVLYELLTGHVPFSSDDPVEMVHSHIAREPIPPNTINSSVPDPVSQIILKLLSKNVTERYQSAKSLQKDLEECLREYQKTGKLEKFDATHGQSDIFKIPSTLYGRDMERLSLLKPYDLVRKGGIEYLLVSGPAGIGKTFLVQDAAGSFVEAGACFLSGKFDQFRRDTAYAPLIEAFGSLIKHILTLSSEEINGWKMRLQQAVGGNGQVLVQVIPEMELIIGKQTQLSDLEPAETENRFNLVVRNFIRICASQDQPLVLFLDDIQWADSNTLKLLQVLICDSTVGYLYIIGSYRSEEVSEGHPLQQMIDLLADSGHVGKSIELVPLELEQVGRMLEESLDQQTHHVDELAQIIHRKTGGNTCFVIQFLYSLHQEGYLFYKQDAGGWQWDLSSINQMNITDNLVEFMTDRVRRLEGSAQRLIAVAACLGNRFEQGVLAQTVNRPLDEIVTDLELAISKGLLFKINSQGAVDFPKAQYCFSHDKIHQAAYALFAFVEQQKTHLKIARLLLETKGEQYHSENIFLITGHYNKGIDFVESQSEKEQLIQLNLHAGKRARDSAAFTYAYDYLKNGIKLTDELSWQISYDLTLQLYLAAMEAAYLSKDFSLTEELFVKILKNAKSLMDKAGAYEIRIQAYKAQNRLLEAVRTGLAVLRLFGLNYSENPSKLQLIISLFRTKIMLRNKEPEDLFNLPAMANPQFQMITRLVFRTGTAAIFSVPPLLPILGFKLVRLSMQHGNTPQLSLMGLPVYGFLLCSAVGDIETGYRFGKTALRSQKKLYGEVHPQTQYLFSNLISHWKDHLRDSLPKFLKSYHGLCNLGDLEFAANSAFAYSYRLYFVGMNLQQAEKEMLKYQEAIRQLGQEAHLYRQNLVLQATHDLQSGSAEPGVFQGKYYSEREMLPINQAAGDKTTLLFVYLIKSIHAFLFHKYTQASQWLGLAEENLSSGYSSPIVPLFYFYDSIVRMSCIHSCSSFEMKRSLKKVNSNQKKMRKWAKFAPKNYKHKYELIEAERAAYGGDVKRAMDYFDRAANNAQEQSYLQEEALAWERAAQFYTDINKPYIAANYGRMARYCYNQWGAASKVAQLDGENPLLHSNRDASGSNLLNIDMISVVKTSRALAEEIVLEDFLKKMMRIMLESAGAQRGVLILERNEKYYVWVKGDTERDTILVIKDGAPDSGENFAITVVNYTSRTSENVMLRNAAGEGMFTHDPYIIKHQPKSVFCTPIIHQGKISCILYLENNLTTGAFSPEREELLRHLGAQAAISLHNTYLFSQLSDTVEQLHQEMDKRKHAQEQVLHAEKLAAVGRLSSSIAHEFGNPLMGVKFLLNNLQGKKILSVEDHELIDIGLEECSRMKVLIRNLQQLNRPSIGVKEVLDVHEILDNTLLFQKKLFDRNNITLVKKYDYKIPEIMGVKDQLIQVFINLILNAVYAIPDSGGILSVSTASAGDSVSVTISDTGVGIPEIIQQQIFEPFFTTKPDVEGSGQGLPVSYGIIKSHGGSITVSSSPGEGASFTVNVPIKPVKNPSVDPVFS